MPEGHLEMMQLGSINVREELRGDENIQYHIMPKEGADMDVLTSEEKDILNRVAKKFRYCSAQGIADYMHEETAYKNTKDGEFISYEFAKEIRSF